ncbi:MAG TPA: hypothetical protein VET65_01835 [Candidatus Limnocylindrales bacterium]|nr:hypothetical protein [Candidatus Limnocylindrales bacterium]
MGIFNAGTHGRALRLRIPIRWHSAQAAARSRVPAFRPRRPSLRALVSLSRRGWDRAGVVAGLLVAALVAVVALSIALR